MARTDFLDTDRVLVTNRNGTSFRGLLSQLVTYIGSFLRPYKVYTFEIFATGMADPTLTIFENTVGNIVWTRSAGGEYIGTLSGAFTNQKTWCMISAYIQPDGTPQFTRLFPVDTDVVKIYNTDKSYTGLVEPLYNIFGEIRVYN